VSDATEPAVTAGSMMTPAAWRVAAWVIPSSPLAASTTRYPWLTSVGRRKRRI